MKQIDMITSDETASDATFSPCGLYRYTLSRHWSEAPYMAFVMLNPSTADEVANDPTVERCERRARSMGFGGLQVANLFALRATDPRELGLHPAPIGPENDEAILRVAAGAGMVVCAWGADGRFMGREAHVLDLLMRNGIALYALQINKDGTPRHPLYVAYEKTPMPWKMPFGSRG